MKKLILLSLLIFVVLIGTAIPADALECNAGPWFDSAQTGPLYLVNFERDQHCQWNTPADRMALQLAGFCGLPEQPNGLIVLTHNLYCSSYYCAAVQGTMAGIALLRPGDQVSLCMEGGKVYTGHVLESFQVYHGTPTPQTDFPCPTRICGTAVTSFGWRQGSTQPYWLVRIGYQ